MILPYSLPQNFLPRLPNRQNITLNSYINKRKMPQRLRIITNAQKKKCLRCGTLYTDLDNFPIACSFHGHTNGFGGGPIKLHLLALLQFLSPGEKGLLALAPPHQGIDGEWSDKSGIIVYKWNEKKYRPNAGRANWKKRWSCCAEYGENAPPCRQGWHVSYDDGFTLY